MLSNLERIEFKKFIWLPNWTGTASSNFGSPLNFFHPIIQIGQHVVLLPILTKWIKGMYFPKTVVIVESDRIINLGSLNNEKSNDLQHPLSPGSLSTNSSRSGFFLLVMLHPRMMGTTLTAANTIKVFLQLKCSKSVCVTRLIRRMPAPGPSDAMAVAIDRCLWKYNGTTWKAAT